MSKSVNIDGLPIRPLPGEMQSKVACTNCRERPARWEFASGGRAARSFACSACFLYEYPRVKEQREAVEFLIESTERKLGLPFPKDEEGKLCREEDADRISFGIVMAARYVQARKRNSVVQSDEYFPVRGRSGVR